VRSQSDNRAQRKFANTFAINRNITKAFRSKMSTVRFYGDTRSITMSNMFGTKDMSAFRPNARIEIARIVAEFRPIGPTEHSPELSPKTDASWSRHLEINRALKGRHKCHGANAHSTWIPYPLDIPSRTRAGPKPSIALAGLDNIYCAVSQGIGLRPRPWAMLGRPVGPSNSNASLGQPTQTGPLVKASSFLKRSSRDMGDSMGFI
jgi:hypothetical protein